MFESELPKRPFAQSLANAYFNRWTEQRFHREGGSFFCRENFPVWLTIMTLILSENAGPEPWNVHLFLLWATSVPRSSPCLVRLWVCCHVDTNKIRQKLWTSAKMGGGGGGDFFLYDSWLSGTSVQEMKMRIHSIGGNFAWIIFMST